MKYKLNEENIQKINIKNYRSKMVAKRIKENNRGITLIALVITIVVLLILAGVSLAMLTGENGILSNASLAKISTEFASYKEELELYKTNKLLENNNFDEESLIAGQNTITYEGKPEEETGNIKTVIQSLADKYLKKFIIIKGKLYLIATEETSDVEIKAAQNTGIEVMPYEISEEGELLSSNVNLALQGTNGTLTIPEIVTSIGDGAFSGVEGLKKVILPPSVTEIGAYAFANNKELEEVEIQGELIKIGEFAFDGANNLSKINLPDSISSIGRRAFRSTNLNSVTIPKNLKTILELTFSNCNNLNTVIFQEGINQIDFDAFNSTNISQLSFPSTLQIVSGTAFANCNNLDEFDLSKNQYFVYESGILMTKKKEEIIYISNKVIKNMTTFEIPEGIKSFTVDISQYTNIKNVIIPISLNSISMRYLPTSIENIEVKTGNSTYISENGILYTNNNVLIGCYSKERNIKIPEGIKELAANSFKQATNAEIIDLPDSLEKINDHVFRYNTKNKEINIGKNVSFIETRFKWMNYNGTVNIDSENKYYKVEDNILYKKDENGEPSTLVRVLYQINGTIQIPSTVKEIGAYSFYGQRKMTEISIPKGVETISNSVFTYCSILKKVEISNTVKTIGNDCFADATNELEEIIIHNKEGSISGAPWGAVKGMRVVKWDK